MAAAAGTGTFTSAAAADGRVPWFAACGENLETIETDACAALMGPACATASLQPVDASDPGGPSVPRSLLLDPASLCSTWRAAVSLDGSPTAQAALDASMYAYCRTNAAATAPECACANFPVTAAAWCGLASVSSGVSDPNLCLGSHFEFMSSDASSLEVLALSPPSSYGCWFAPCRDAPSQQLIPTSLQQVQRGTYVVPGTDGDLKLACGGVCMLQSSNESAVQLPPLPGSLNQVGVNVFQCGTDVEPFLVGPSTLPLQLAVPVNAAAVFDLPLSNGGSAGALFARYDPSVGTPWAAIEPDTLVLNYGQTAANAQLVLNRDNLGTVTYAPQTGSVSLLWTNVSANGTVTPERFWVPFQVTLIPAVAPTVVTTTTFSQTLKVLTILAAVFALIALVFAIVHVRSARANVARAQAFVGRAQRAETEAATDRGLRALQGLVQPQ